MKQHQISSSRQSSLRVERLTKRYGAVTALEDVTFDINPGEVVALVGDNGAGKSTTVKLLSGAITPTSGRVYVDGQETALVEPQVAREAGIETVYQDLALALNLSISANIYLGREVYRGGAWKPFHVLDNRTMHARAKDELDKLHIRVPHVRHKCADLSGGQRQAVAVARAVTWGSKVIIMDEPTAALGVEEQHQVGELIKKIKSRGMSVLLVSHNIPQVHEVADRILVLFQGRLIADLTRNESSVEDIVRWITGAALTS